MEKICQHSLKLQFVWRTGRSWSWFDQSNFCTGEVTKYKLGRDTYMNSTHAFCLLPSAFCLLSWQITPSSIHNCSYHIKAESNDSSSFSNLCCIGVLLSDKVLAGLYNTSNTNSLYIALHLALKHLQEKIMVVRDSNPWPLWYRCSGLPIDLTSELGAGCWIVQQPAPSSRVYNKPIIGLL